MPALARTWPRGHVKGLRARGDLTVDIRWEAGRAEEIVLTAGRAGPVVLRSDLLVQRYTGTDATSGTAITISGSGMTHGFTAQAMHRYVLRRRK
jgi:alpha-L-fucosidase 2